MSSPAITTNDSLALWSNVPREEMDALEQRCHAHFGEAIQSAKAVWTPMGESPLAVELRAWDGRVKVVPEHELERVGV